MLDGDFGWEEHSGAGGGVGVEERYVNDWEIVKAGHGSDSLFTARAITDHVLL